jgi:hypothetical protein
MSSSVGDQRARVPSLMTTELIPERTSPTQIEPGKLECSGMQVYAILVSSGDHVGRVPGASKDPG